VRIRGKGDKDRVVALHRVASKAAEDYLATRDDCMPEAPLMLLGQESLETTEGYPYMSPMEGREAVAKLPGVPRRTTASGLSTGARVVEFG
jgi:hypothetical protein